MNSVAEAIIAWIFSNIINDMICTVETYEEELEFYPIFWVGVRITCLMLSPMEKVVGIVQPFWQSWYYVALFLLFSLTKYLYANHRECYITYKELE